MADTFTGSWLWKDSFTLRKQSTLFDCCATIRKTPLVSGTHQKTFSVRNFLWAIQIFYDHKNNADEGATSDEAGTNGFAVFAKNSLSQG